MCVCLLKVYKWHFCSVLGIYPCSVQIGMVAVSEINKQIN